MNKRLTRITPHCQIKPLAAALVIAGFLSACGGGGGNSGQPAADNTGGSNGGTSSSAGNSSGGNSSGNTGTNTGSTGTTAATVMSCDDGTNYQCSGKSVVSTGDVALTDFGVQAYGRASSDATVNPVGLQLDSGGTTEVRLARDNSGAIKSVAVLLSGLGLSWDGKTERPKIIETFDPRQGRTTQGANDGALSSVALPASDNLGFYDYATKGVAGTQANYANNHYFPRNNNPARCGPGYPTTCVADDPTKETSGLQYQAGDVQSGVPDSVTAWRFHEDGDVHAGDASNGGWLAGGSGHGVPFPGSKGYRAFTGLSYQYANVGSWFTQDTVSIAEWTAADGSSEHNTNRRGIVAFGALTNPAMIPATGSTTYSGRIIGRYASAKDADPIEFRGTATVSVNFAAHQATITIQSDSGAVPVFTATTTVGGGSGNLANSMTGAVNSGGLSGTVRARFFGPVVTTGSSGQGPAETGGAFSLKDPATGAAVIGGFIARKQ